MWDWPNLFSIAKSIFIDKIYFHLSSLICEVYDVRPNATKTYFFPKNPSLKNSFVCYCGNGQIYFHWPNLFSLAKSIFTRRIYFLANMVYVPAPHKLIYFRKIARTKKHCISMWDCRFCVTAFDKY